MNLALHIEKHLEVVSNTFDSIFLQKINETGLIITERLKKGGKIFLMGNGGSAADSQHIAAEFVSKLSIDRKPLAALALTVDTSAITAISNDYGYDYVFSRQIEALVNDTDVVIGISTSGNSKNVILGFDKATEIGAFTIGFSGSNGFKNKMLNACFSIKSNNTARIQEGHILLGHLLCGVSESHYV